MQNIYTKLSGVTHHNADCTNRQEIIAELCFPDQPLLLILEPNQYSQNNIGVYVAFQVGYINPDLAEKLAMILDEGGVVNAHIADITGGIKDKPTLGVNVVIQIYE